MSDGYNKWLDALQKSIDLRKKELDNISDLYTYQKNISKLAKETANYEKQWLSLQGDNSEENKSRLQKITVALQDSRDSLQESEYEQWKTDQQKMLDTLSSDAESFINERLDNIDGLISDVIKATNSNSNEIKGTLERVTSDVGTTLSSDMKNIWTSTDGVSATVREYGKSFGEKITSVGKTLTSIEEYVKSISDGSVEPEKATEPESPIVPDTKTDTKPDTTTTDTKSDTTKKTTQSKVLDTTSKVFNSVIPGLGVGDVIANTTKLAMAKSFIEKNKLKPSQKKEHYASLNRYLYDKVGGVLSKSNEMKLAKMLGVKLTTKDLTGEKGKKDIDNILKALKKVGFAKGGTIGKAIKRSGEDGFILARTGEEVLSLEKIKALGDSFKALNPIISNVKTMIPTNIPVRNQNIGGNNIGDVEMNINLPNVTNYEDFKSNLIKDKQIEQFVQTVTFGNALGKNSLSKYKL